MAGKLFDSMVSVRPSSGNGEPHLGLGLYIVRLIAEFHGGRAEALDREDGSGVVMRVGAMSRPTVDAVAPTISPA